MGVRIALQLFYERMRGRETIYKRAKIRIQYKNEKGIGYEKLFNQKNFLIQSFSTHQTENILLFNINIILNQYFN